MEDMSRRIRINGDNDEVEFVNVSSFDSRRSASGGNPVFASHRSSQELITEIDIRALEIHKTNTKCGSESCYNCCKISSWYCRASMDCCMRHSDSPCHTRMESTWNIIVPSFVLILLVWKIVDYIVQDGDDRSFTVFFVSIFMNCAVQLFFWSSRNIMFDGHYDRYFAPMDTNFWGTVKGYLPSWCQCDCDCCEEESCTDAPDTEEKESGCLLKLFACGCFCKDPYTISPTSSLIQPVNHPDRRIQLPWQDFGSVNHVLFTICLVMFFYVFEHLIFLYSISENHGIEHDLLTRFEGFVLIMIGGFQVLPYLISVFFYFHFQSMLIIPLTCATQVCSSTNPWIAMKSLEESIVAQECKFRNIMTKLRLFDVWNLPTGFTVKFEQEHGGKVYYDPKGDSIPGRHCTAKVKLQNPRLRNLYTGKVPTERGVIVNAPEDLYKLGFKDGMRFLEVNGKAVDVCDDRTLSLREQRDSIDRKIAKLLEDNPGCDVLLDDPADFSLPKIFEYHNKVERLLRKYPAELQLGWRLTLLMLLAVAYAIYFAYLYTVTESALYYIFCSGCCVFILATIGLAVVVNEQGNKTLHLLEHNSMYMLHKHNFPHDESFDINTFISDGGTAIQIANLTLTNMKEHKLQLGVFHYFTILGGATKKGLDKLLVLTGFLLLGLLLKGLGLGAVSEALGI